MQCIGPFLGFPPLKSSHKIIHVDRVERIPQLVRKIVNRFCISSPSGSSPGAERNGLAPASRGLVELFLFFFFFITYLASSLLPRAQQQTPFKSRFKTKIIHAFQSRSFLPSPPPPYPSLPPTYTPDSTNTIFTVTCTGAPLPSTQPPHPHPHPHGPHLCPLHTTLGLSVGNC